MEHEVFVPVPLPALRRTLGDPARVARCVPGLQQDADASAGPLVGRLKFRADGHTITYRGALTLKPSDTGDSFSVTGKGTEARGTGAAELALTVGLTETDGGTTIGFTGTAGGEGRIVDLDPSAALTAAQRLLDRFTQQLVTESLATRESEGGAGLDTLESEGPESDASASVASEPEGPESGASGASDASDASDASGDKDSVFDAPVPPPSLDPATELEFTVPDEPPAEAAHARRTMIGRSTEEVDHAPPRGRYAPVPSPEAGAAGIALRWAAPAAALAIASAVVVGRALRRRRP
ncbi:SRPBCC domain-containing protein [Streptomyces sp. NBC_01012]|uniref:SRPBCC domain-containing protein n=1 Tax=Streptomyces sp. NBC_01012 TaxID=2903717 RepID=UPI00386E4755|nr:SRPBCC domain-containing protein [Streptomyces sp. NBC_01012]